jgi:HEAT repeat protein
MRVTIWGKWRTRADVTAFQQRLDDYCRQHDGELPFLASAPPASLDDLLARLGDLPRGEQSAVVRFIAQTKHRTAVPALLKFLPHASANLAEEMAQVIATQGGDQAGPILLDILSATDLPVGVRRAVVYALVWLFDPRAIPTLLACCRDQQEDPVIRTTAAEGLMYLARDLEPDSAERQETEQVFLAGLTDPQVEVRYWSVYAVGGMGVVSALPLLAQLAQEDVGYDTTHDCWIRDEAVEAIRIIDPTCQTLAGLNLTQPGTSQARIA